MPRPPAIQRAIDLWRLGERLPAAVRWMPPESFLPHPDLAYDPDFRAARSAQSPRRAPVAAAELAALRAFGSPPGLSAEAALALLRRARHTRHEVEVAEAVLLAPGPLPEAIRIEAAYLFAANQMPEHALRLLDRPEAGLDGEAPAHAAAGAIAADLQRLAMLDAFPSRRPVLAPLPPPLPVDAAPPGPPPVPEIDVARLLRFGLPGGPSPEEALSALRRARGTGQGVRALRHVLAARRYGPLPEAVRAAGAELLTELGYHDRAFALLADQPVALPPEAPEPGIDVDTPLRESDAARRAAEAERVLAVDAARLGVPERHARFQAVARAAQLTAEAFQALGGRPKRDAARDVAWALEEAGETGRAAEIAVLGGDLAEAGRLGVPPRRAPGAEAGAVLAEMDALDRRGQRLAAVGVGRAFLAGHADAEVAAAARGLLARLCRGPRLTLALDGEEVALLLGDVVTVGRVEASLTIPSPLVSRAHVRLFRRDGVALVEDLGSHNGTWLAGARLAAPLPIGAGVALALGGQIPCSLVPAPGALAGAIAVTVAGERWIAPLGPLDLGVARLATETREAELVVTLRLAPGGAAWLEEAPVASAIELSPGDRLRLGGAAPREIRVVG
jgi:hypothetical protein